jgi:hypothetical protein
MGVNTARTLYIVSNFKPTPTGKISILKVYLNK